MNRLFRVSVLVLSAIALSAGTALAIQPPDGPLGKPDSVLKEGGTWNTLVVPTASCDGFAPAGSLTFEGVRYSGTSKYWETAQWRDWNWWLEGALTTGGVTYELRAHLENFSSFWADTWMGYAKPTITRSDGGRMSGNASISFMEEAGLNQYSFGVHWQGTVTCR